MNRKIIIREFEERDIDFVLKLKQIIENKRSSKDSKFITNESGVDWFRKLKEQPDVKYWAISSNDSFQNIVGWTCLKINKAANSAMFGGATIGTTRYNNASVYYDTYSTVMDEVFNTMQISSVCCVNSEISQFHHVFNSIFFPNGLLTKELYIKYSKEDFLTSLEKRISEGGNLSCDLEGFLSLIKNNLESSSSLRIDSKTRFRDMEEWSSLYAIEFVSIVESLFHARLDADDFLNCDTFGDLYQVINKKSLETKLSNIEPVMCEFF